MPPLNNITEKIASLLPLLGLAGIALSIPAVPVGAVTWVIYSATYPDILTFWQAIGVGGVLGIALVRGAIGIASRLTGDAFPDFVAGVLLPCGLVCILCAAAQPVAAKITELRLKHNRPAKLKTLPSAGGKRKPAPNQAPDISASTPRM